MLQRIVSSLAYRVKWARLKPMYNRLSFPPSERERQEHEFHKIVFDDCYRLQGVPHASTVLDIGANVGLFALAARRRFPQATIHCYEPNPAVLSYLRAHAGPIGAVCYPEAVGLYDGKISLQMSDDGSLFSVAKQDASGQITQRSFASAVARLDKVDLLKLDCEGAEWALFEDRETWKSVDRLVMEYHLWANEGATVSILRDTLASIGFRHIDISDDGRMWGMAFAVKSGKPPSPATSGR